MTNTKVKCPLCQKFDVPIQQAGGLSIRVTCPLCGCYVILTRVIDAISQWPKHVLCGVTRNSWETNRLEFIISADNAVSFEKLCTTSPVSIPSDVDIPSKSDLILYHLRRRTDYPGEVLRLIAGQDISIAFCRNYNELHFCVNYLEKRGLIECVTFENNADVCCKISAEGWAYLFGIGTDAKDQGFIAMAFSLDISNQLRDEGLIAGVAEAGYSPMRIDGKEHNNHIDDEIVAEIRKSKFVVADLTGKNAGAYFEAGFAMGLNKPVIWTCQQTEIDAGNVHFDTRQYSIVSWEPDKLADFATRLTQRIEATIGHGRYVAEAEKK